MGHAFDRAAEALFRQRPSNQPRLREARALLEKGLIGPAASKLRALLKSKPEDADALYLLAQALATIGRQTESRDLLARCLETDPGFTAARYNYLNSLLDTNDPAAALVQVEVLLAGDPENPLFRRVNAIALESLEDFAGAAPLWKSLLEAYPTETDCGLRYGHALRLAGEREASVAAYRRLTELDPSCGAAWWALADLKTYRFSDVDIILMEQQFGAPDLSADDRVRLHFALGKAYADAAQYEKSFAHYAKGNALHRVRIKHDPETLTAYVARCRKVFTEEFFRARSGFGSDSSGPVFIVGMARSGSTLVEQILASHSQIEGTKELANLAMVSRQIQTAASASNVSYPEFLTSLDAGAFCEFGNQYLESTRAHRMLGRPHFTDKMGANLAHIGLIHLILPHAKIVDVRRHPLACGFSIFAQFFHEGQNDAYRLTDIGRVYRDYVALMAHFDHVLPGKVHRVFYEELVANPEKETRRLLDYLGLPFEKNCLAFHKTKRVVATVSSEQVRRPITGEAVAYWRNFEPWLAPLSKTLGPVLSCYPDVPAEMR